MAKQIPERQCIGCLTKKNKKELIRIVRSPEGIFSLDASGRAAGRGAYICNDRACLDSAFKKHSLDKAFKEMVSSEVYEKLKGEFEGLG